MLANMIAFAIICMFLPCWSVFIHFLVSLSLGFSWTCLFKSSLHSSHIGQSFRAAQDSHKHTHMFVVFMFVVFIVTSDESGGTDEAS